MGAVYEADFLGFSYGFRPGRSQHNALDAVTVGIERRKVGWVLDVDSQYHRMTWKRFSPIADRWIPNPRILHPYPIERLCVTT